MFSVLLVCIFVGLANAAKFQGYGAPRATSYAGPVVPILVDERQAPDAAGFYNLNFETGDGIIRQEQGSPQGPTGAVAQRGGWSFTFPDGTPAVFSYVADENGYRVESNLLPTPPPVPAHALRQIERAGKQKSSFSSSSGSLGNQRSYSTPAASSPRASGFPSRPASPSHFSAPSRPSSSSRPSRPTSPFSSSSLSSGSSIPFFSLPSSGSSSRSSGSSSRFPSSSRSSGSSSPFSSSSRSSGSSSRFPSSSHSSGSSSRFPSSSHSLGSSSRFPSSSRSSGSSSPFSSSSRRSGSSFFSLPSSGSSSSFSASSRSSGGASGFSSFPPAAPRRSYGFP